MTNVRKCFLCGRSNQTAEQLLYLFKFPSNPETRSAWFNFCGLCESVDKVSNLRICSLHFNTADVTRCGRLKPRAVPSLSAPKKCKPPTASNYAPPAAPYETVTPGVLSSSVELSQFSTVTTSTPTSSAFHVKIEQVDVSNEGSSDKEVDETSHITVSVDVSKESFETIAGSSDFAIDVCQTPKCKRRRFNEPRFVQEINTADIGTPQRARRALSLVKASDKLKSKKIKKLQDQNRYLRKKVSLLEELVAHLCKNPELH